MAYRSHGLCSYELTSSSWPTTSKQQNEHAMLTGSANSVIFVGPKRVAKNSVQSACSVFDNRIGTVLPYRNKIMRFILEKV